MKKLIGLLVIGVVAPFAVYAAEADSPAMISQLSEMVRVLTEQVRLLQAQVLARTNGLVMNGVRNAIKVEEVPILPEVSGREWSLADATAIPPLPEVPQKQSVRPEVVITSQKSGEVWYIGDDFSVSWKVSGFGRPSLNAKDVEVLLLDAEGINPLGYLCRRCETAMIGLDGNEGSVTGRVGIMSTEDRKLKKIQPGYYRLLVRIASLPSVAALGDSTFTVSAPRNSQNLVPSIAGISMPKIMKAGQIIVFKVEAYDPDSSVLRYRMNPGDGALGEAYILGVASSDMFSGEFTYTYTVPGTYEVVFVVLDERGAGARSSQFVTIVP